MPPDGVEKVRPDAKSGHVDVGAHEQGDGLEVILLKPPDAGSAGQGVVAVAVALHFLWRPIIIFGPS